MPSNGQRHIYQNKFKLYQYVGFLLLTAKIQTGDCLCFLPNLKLKQHI